MDAVTYPDAGVAGLLADAFIPVRLAWSHQTLAARYHVSRTPSLHVLGVDGQEFHRGEGFQPPEEFIPFALLGAAKARMAGGQPGGLALLERVLADFPRSAAAPEAVYRRGVRLFKETGDAKNLKAVYERLQADFPDSEWTRRAHAYGLL